MPQRGSVGRGRLWQGESGPIFEACTNILNCATWSLIESLGFILSSFIFSSASPGASYGSNISCRAVSKFFHIPRSNSVLLASATAAALSMTCSFQAAASPSVTNSLLSSFFFFSLFPLSVVPGHLHVQYLHSSSFPLLSDHYVYYIPWG